MRLWHYKLLPYLPGKQLISQWKELNSIFKNETKHLLIDYNYNHSKMYLYNYTKLVLDEFANHINSLEGLQYAENLKILSLLNNLLNLYKICGT